MLCTDAFKQTIRGDYGTPDFRYIKISLNPCKPDKKTKKKCAKDKDVWKFFSKDAVNFSYIETHTDKSKKDNIIQTSSNEKQFVIIEPGLKKGQGTNKKLNFYLRPGQVKTSYLGRSEKFETFEVGHLDKYDEVYDDGYLDIYFRLDEMAVNYTRNEYSLFVWLAMLGGIQKIIKTYFGRLIGVLAGRKFINEMLTELFYVKRRAPTDVEGERKSDVAGDTNAAFDKLNP